MDDDKRIADGKRFPRDWWMETVLAVLFVLIALVALLIYHDDLSVSEPLGGIKSATDVNLGVCYAYAAAIATDVHIVSALHNSMVDADVFNSSVISWFELVQVNPILAGKMGELACDRVGVAQ